MAPKNKRSASADSDDHDALALRVVELLKDPQVLETFRKALFPDELSSKIDNLHKVIDQMRDELKAKDTRIKCLEQKVESMEEQCDQLEQYSRRPNLRLSGVPETGEGEDTTAKVMAIVNGKLGLTPPLQPHHIERSHRVGKRLDDGHRGRPRSRPIIIRFVSERTRDAVYRARTALKEHNHQHRDDQLYINDDLTTRRAKMAYDTRTMKKDNKIMDCWTSYGKVLIKDLTSKVIEIKSLSDLLKI